MTKKFPLLGERQNRARGERENQSATLFKKYGEDGSDCAAHGKKEGARSAHPHCFYE